MNPPLFTRIILGLLVFGIFGNCSQPTTKQELTKGNDTLSYETITMINSYNDCDPTAENCTYVSLEYPQFTNALKPLEDTLTARIHSFIGGQLDNKPLDPSDVLTAFIEDYSEFVKKDTTYKTPWALERNAVVYNQNPKFITLKLTEYVFEGGAHPNEFTQYILIDKSSGAQKKLTDYFDSTAINKLTTIGENVFCAQKGISPSTGLEDAGYSFNNNHFALNNNFYFSDTGITFYYNTYEIGPYVLGPTALTIPAAKITRLLKP
jgi:hypothetical protein